MQNIELSIMYTPYTIDTYQTFTFEGDEEMICDDLGVEYDYIEWEYRNDEYIQALADNWIVLMNDNILDDVILKVNARGKAISPKEYNYRTDDMDISFDVNLEALNSYIDSNLEAYNRDKIGSCSGFTWLGDELETRLHYYLNAVSLKKYTDEYYLYDQLEIPSYEYIDYKLIDKKNDS